MTLYRRVELADGHVKYDPVDDEIERLTERCAAYKGQVEAGAHEIDRLRAGYEAIKRAAVDGKVCDDVAWFDTITTLYDFCDLMLNNGFRAPQQRVDKPQCLIDATTAGEKPPNFREMRGIFK